MSTSKRYGVIQPSKKNKPHVCSMPLFNKPEGSLFRCETCGEVWKQCTHPQTGYFWGSSTLQEWVKAGGVE